MAWLDPVIQALNHRTRPVEIFVRDDDGGWEDQRLLSLLDLFGAEQFPIDLALIPTAVRPNLARQLAAHARAMPLGIHQHGFAHLNHEPTGRPCEFGPSRPASSQRDDITDGRRRLLEILGPCVDPIFTPPWNRCTVATAICIRQAGFRVLSRDVTAIRLDLDDLAELPTAIDWFARSGGCRLTREAWGARLGTAIDRAREPLGLMLHHAVMDDREQRACAALLRVLARHPLVTGLRMRDAARAAVGGES